MKRIFIITLTLLFFVTAYGQDIKYARKTINTLCSPKFHGRGYVKGGDAKAAAFIYKEFKKLKEVEVQYQPFVFPVNTFPGKMKVKVGGKTLEPGVDYMVDPGCPNAKGEFEVGLATYEVFKSDKNYTTYIDELAAAARVKKLIVLDTLPTLNESEKKRLKAFKEIIKGQVDGLIILTNKKLIWSVDREQAKHPEITIREEKFNRGAKEIELNIKAELLPQHTANNVLAYIKGTRRPDSTIVMCAHYDHLGRMGKKTYFPGANDNASGIALMLDMANYYSQHPPEYSILFIAFAAEEAGLIGSQYYVTYPVYPLDKMRFLINMDLMATGEKGMMAVNGLVFEDEYKALVKLNDDKKYLPNIQARGKAANSDHYWFTEKGVHSFFFYLMGDFPSYHDPGDKAEIVPLTEYEDTFRLLRDFVGYLEGK